MDFLHIYWSPKVHKSHKIILSRHIQETVCLCHDAAAATRGPSALHNPKKADLFLWKF